MGGAQEGAYGWLAVNYLHQVPARLVPARSHADAFTRLRNSACEEELPRDAYKSMRCMPCFERCIACSGSPPTSQASASSSSAAHRCKSRSR